jgi:acyl-coenzyme A synthetase/AMP-(fatty) acid ligase
VTTHDLTLGFLQERLDGRVDREAMPRDLRRVDELPMTSSGKVDRLALASSWTG